MNNIIKFRLVQGYWNILCVNDSRSVVNLFFAAWKYLIWIVTTSSKKEKQHLSKHLYRVCLESVYFAKTENFLLKVLEKKVKVSWNSTVRPINSIKKCVCVWQKLFLPTYFTIQLIFTTIHESYCTFWYYSLISLYYYS